MRAAGISKATRIPRTVAINPGDVRALDAYVDAGAEHVIVMTYPPYDLDPVQRILI